MAKIAIVHYAHWDQLFGGAELQLSYLASHYKSEGYEVHIIFIVRNNNVINDDGMILHPIKNKSFLGIFGKSWFLHAKEVKTALSQIQPDIIITRSLSSIAGICSSYAAARNVMHRHFIANDKEADSPGYIRSLFRIFDGIEWCIYKRIFDKNTTLICQNSAQQDRVYVFYGYKPEIATQMAPIPTEYEFVKSESILHVVWVGNLKEVKRPSIFIELAQMISMNNDIHFTMIGADHGGKYKSLLESAKSIKNYKYLGNITNAEVNNVFASAHVLINTSESEGFSNTFIQAWLREVVVISMNSNPDEILTREKIGFLSNSIDEISKLVINLSRNRDLLREMSIKSRAYALQNHTFKVLDQ